MMTSGEFDLTTRVTPAWFDRAKLGLFVHWNAASIPAYAPTTSLEDMMSLPPDADGVGKMWRRLPYAEMYQNSLNISDSPTARYHAEHYGDLTYDAFVERFRDEMLPRWDPTQLAGLAVRAGARYVVLTTKTEDGFLLWPSERRNPSKAGWQSERDVVGELAAALRERGIRFGTYYSGGVDWTFRGLPMKDMEGLVEAMRHDEAYLDYANAHWHELIERYLPDVMWNDYSYPAGADVDGLFRFYLEHVPDGVINNRFEHRNPGDVIRNPSSTVYADFLTPEYSTEGAPEHKWEACRGLGTSFGYNRQESSATYLTPAQLIHTFVDVVSRGGNLLINVGPTATGDIPWPQAERLIALGWWLGTNGRAVYETRPWDHHAGITGDGIPVRYTSSDDAVHAIVLGAPTTTEVEIDVELAPGARVSLEGQHGDLRWTQAASGMRVTLPELLDRGPAAAFRLEPASLVRPLATDPP
jgi:alpha-L-fucosidase